MTVRIIANASKQRSDNVFFNTGQSKLSQKRTIGTDADPLTFREPNEVAYAPLWGKLALASAMFGP